MSFRDLKSSGHWPTLLAAFLYFDLSFCVWYLLGPLGSFISEDLGLSATQTGLLIATPLLGGSIFRIAMGALTDQIGPRRTGLLGIGLTFVPLFLGWAFADSLPKLFLVSLLLGVPGASFAVALPLASRWYPPQHQGLVMGIAGAGNSGTVLASIFVPRLAAAYGWQNAFGLAALPMALAGIVFLFCAKDSPNQPPPKKAADYLAVLRQMDTLWFCLFYSITFGGFVGLASFLGVFFRDQYGVSKIAAGDLTALCVFAGSFMRPVGGWVADRLGGIRTLGVVYGAMAMLLAAIAATPPVWVETPLFVVALALLGAGNGAVFQLVSLRFRAEIGVVTGLVGAAGGLGGFFLPSLLGLLRDVTGTYATGLVGLAAVCVWGATLLVALQSSWRMTWAAREEMGAEARAARA